MHYFALLLSPETTSAPVPRRRPPRWRPIRTSTPRRRRPSAPATRCRRRRPGFASPAGPTLRPSPTARSPRAPRWPAATTCSRPRTSTRRWRSPATSRPPSTAPSRCGRWSTSRPARAPLTSDSWLALLLEPPGSSVRAGQPGVGGGHQGAHRVRQGRQAITSVGGAPLHPPTTATTVRVRDGEVLLTDGPVRRRRRGRQRVLLHQRRRPRRGHQVASMIPASTVELRQLAGISGL